MTSPVPKVGHVVISLAPGGLERLVVDWTLARNAAHAETTKVGCLDGLGELAADLDPGEVTSFDASRERLPWDREAVRKLRAWVRREGLSVVHSHNLAAQQYAALAVRGTGVRHVHTEHGSNLHTSGAINRARLWVLAHVTDCLVAVANDTAQRMAPVWGVPPGRVAVIPNGVAPHAVTGAAKLDALRRELGLAKDAIVLGSVGRLASVKGFDRLLGVLPALAQRHAGLRWVLVGSGGERAVLETQAIELGVQDRLVFAGFRADARAFYEIFDLFVAPSRSEGLPVALLEAMAAGCPVGVTDAGEQRAVIGDGAAGVMLPEDAREWVEILGDSLDAEGRAARMALAGVARQRVAEHYSLERTLAAYERVYGGMQPEPA
ncbi:MAG: glycosyltransferase [Verrucomicrobia bacterium]|nr:glycosyltransferase [Verrucomicrobiota bacterium]